MIFINSKVLALVFLLLSPALYLCCICVCSQLDVWSSDNCIGPTCRFHCASWRHRHTHSSPCACSSSDSTCSRLSWSSEEEARARCRSAAAGFWIIYILKIQWFFPKNSSKLGDRNKFDFFSFTHKVIYEIRKVIANKSWKAVNTINQNNYYVLVKVRLLSVILKWLFSFVTQS